MGLDPNLIEESEQPAEGAPAWMATFSDLATNMLTFFVLLLSFANMDAKQFREALGSVRDALGVNSSEPGRYEARSTTIVEIGEAGGKTMLKESSAMRRIRDAVARRGIDGSVEVSSEEKGVVLRVRDYVLFDTASDRVRDEGIPVLEGIADVVNGFDGPVAIEGHTDNRPISSAKFPSNWELSAFRATAVLRHLVSHGVARDRLAIAGYADTIPIGDNSSEEGRARNRRVEFVFPYEGLKKPPAKDKKTP